MIKFRKAFKVTLIVLIGIIGLLFAAPLLFKKQITNAVNTQINNNINAQVAFEDLNISFLRNFPAVSITLENISIAGIGNFAGDTLLSAEKIGVAVSIASLISGDQIAVNKIYAVSPRVHAMVNADGSANWDIMKETGEITDTTESSSFNLKLKKYNIDNGYVYYDDRESNMNLEISGLNHSGSGDFTSDLFTLQTESEASEVTFRYGMIPYLYKVNTTLTSNIKIDNTSSTYSFEKFDANLNALNVTGNGAVKMLQDGYGINFDFKSPSTDFKDILSLIPAIYKTDFDEVTAAGKVKFEGFVKGNYTEASMPAYHIAMSVKDGFFNYNGLPKAVEKIGFDLDIQNPDGISDHTMVELKNGHIEIDKDPLDFRFLVKNPETDMYVDAAAKGKLDLGRVSEFAPLEKGTSLAGLLNADVNIKGNVKVIENKQFNQFYAGGNINMSNFNYTSPEYPDGVKISSLKAEFNPSHIAIPELRGTYLKSNFSGAGKINNLLNYVLLNQALSANLSLNADRINVNDWMGMESTASETETAPEPFLVPGNIDVNLSTQIAKVIYDKLEIQDLAGNLNISDETVFLNKVSGKALDGIIEINGTYSTKINKQHPDVSIDYKVNKVDIQKTFYAFNAVQKLMPIGKFIGGKLTSELHASGSLGKDMSLDVSTLSGNGNLLLIEGLLSKFAPLEKIASTLQVKQLEQLSMKDVKANFEIVNGKMLVKPFVVKANDIEMEIGGMQGIDQNLNYNINMKLPKSLMGDKGNKLVNNLVTSATAKGIPINAGDNVNLKMALKGSILKPELKVDLKQSGESLAAQMQDQAKEFAQAKKDSAKKAANDTLNSIKKQVTGEMKNQLERQITGKKDTTAKPASQTATQSAKGLINNIFRKKQKDSANKSTQ